MGPHAGVDYESLYLVVNSVVSYPPPLQKERGGVGKIFDWARLHLSTNFQTTNRKSECTRREREGMRADLMSLNIDILWIMGNPMPELTLTPLSSLILTPMTMNLGSAHTQSIFTTSFLQLVVTLALKKNLLQVLSFQWTEASNCLNCPLSSSHCWRSFLGGMKLKFLSLLQTVTVFF